MEKYSIISALLSDINLLFNERDFLQFETYSLNCDCGTGNCNCDCGDGCGHDGGPSDCY